MPGTQLNASFTGRPSHGTEPLIEIGKSRRSSANPGWFVLGFRSMRLTAVFSGLFLTFALALTGCGGDDSDGDSGSDDTDSSASADPGDSPDDESEDSGDGSDDDVLDVCGMVSTADLEELFASPFDEGEFTHQEQTGGDQCVWSNSDAPPVKIISISVLRQDHLSEAFESGGVTVQSLFEDTKGYMTDVEELDLGDSSYLSGSQISVLDADSLTDISVSGTSPEAIAGLRSLAEQVIG